MATPLPILSIFFLHAFINGGWLPRIADLQVLLNVDAAQLGIVLAGQPIGAIILFPLASTIIEKFPMAQILGACLTVMIASITLVGSADEPVMAFGLLTVFGAGFALCNIAMNVEADRTEARLDRLIMNRCHGIWSLGLLSATLIGVLMRGLEVSVAWHFILMVPVLAVPALVSTVNLRPAPIRPGSRASPSRASRLAIPTKRTIRLVGIMLAAVLIDTGTASWSVIYIRDTFDLSTLMETTVLPVYLSAVVIGRLVSDRLVARFGRPTVAYTVLSITIVGLVLLTTASSPVTAFVGFIVMGLGVCTIFPMTISAAAQLNDRPAAENVAAVTMSVALILLGAPIVMGWIAETWSIRVSFAILVIPVLAALTLVPILKPSNQSPGS